MLGVPLLRAIDKGLAKSRAGIVLVTPALLTRLASEGIADKELSALLARDQLIPVVHETTYEALREVSPLLGSRSGLNTAEDSMADVAAKIAELVGVLDLLWGGSTALAGRSLFLVTLRVTIPLRCCSASRVPPCTAQ